jgi:hypothetical protein
MLLEGSCHCGQVKYRVQSHTPYPFSRCHCSTCRKLNGGGGYTVNIMADAATLEIEGGEHLTVYRSALNDRGVYEEDGLGFSRRHFCKHCGTMLWNHNPKHANWIYPFASSVDTELPTPSEIRDIMVMHKAPWVEIPAGEQQFPQYPDEGIEDWHKNRGLFNKS